MRTFVCLAACVGALLIGCNSSGSGGNSTAGGIAAASGSANSPQASSKYVSATITRTFDSQGQATSDRMTITDPQELVALSSYFPTAGQAQRGPLAGGWQPAVIIKLKPAVGRQVRILTNYEVWSEGTGDWPAPAGMKDHLNRLFANRVAGSQ